MSSNPPWTPSNNEGGGVHRRTDSMSSSGHAQQAQSRSSSTADLDTDNVSHSNNQYRARGPAAIDKHGYADGISKNLRLTPEQNNDLLQMIEVSPALLSQCGSS